MAGLQLGIARANILAVGDHARDYADALEKFHRALGALFNRPRLNMPVELFPLTHPHEQGSEVRVAYPLWRADRLNETLPFRLRPNADRKPSIVVITEREAFVNAMRRRRHFLGNIPGRRLNALVDRGVEHKGAA